MIVRPVLPTQLIENIKLSLLLVWTLPGISIISDVENLVADLKYAQSVSSIRNVQKKYCGLCSYSVKGVWKIRMHLAQFQN